VRVLFDHNVPRRFRLALAPHEVVTTREMGWDQLENGLLLQAAAGAAFFAFISIDKKLQYEQNLDKLPLPVIVLDAASNALPGVVLFAPFVLELFKAPFECRFHLIKLDGRVVRLGALLTPP
jgi:hypothetical protein